MLGGGRVAFTATVEPLALRNEDGRITAQLVATSYVVAPEPGAPARPVVFAFNGGPGSASAWLHLGTLGPWRLDLNAAAAQPARTPVLIENAESWLPFADLVLLDPVGTGFSRVMPARGGEENGAPAASGERQPAARGRGANTEDAGGFFSVAGDIQSLSDAIAQWLKCANRLASPKFIVGESYGGFRGPLLVESLRERHGLAVNGLVLVSPVLDFGLDGSNRNSAFGAVIRLPSVVAAARAVRGERVSEAQLQAAEAYATGAYLADLLRSGTDPAAMDRLVQAVSTLTGLSDDLVRRAGGRLDNGAVLREALRGEGLVASPYDGGQRGPDSDPTISNPFRPDPFTGALSAPVTSAILALYRERLQWNPPGRYLLLNGQVNGQWTWGRNARSAPQAVSALRNALAMNAGLSVLIVHGSADLVTPYFASKMIMLELPGRMAQDRVSLAVLPGGHMFYSEASARSAFKTMGEAFIRRLSN